MDKIYLLSLFCISLSFASFSQDIEAENVEEFEDTNLVKHTFEGTRVINGHSVETLSKGILEFRIEHRFGDMFGDNGGSQQMWGFDQSSDIRMAFEYGISDKFMAGFGRSKGAGNPYRSLLDGFLKYKILSQSRGGMPITLTALGTSSFTYMEKSTDLTQVASFPTWQNRFAYSAQVNISKKFGEGLSLALMPTVVHRNLVLTTDENTLFSLGGASRIAINSKMAILIEYYHVFADKNLRSTNTNSLGIAFEWITFGHNFTVNLTNSKGFGETQFIPYTYEDWTKGQFRLGFAIGRKFSRE